MTDVLAPATAMGAVTLTVADLDAMTRYYAEGVGLDVLGTDRDSVVLGRGAVAAVVLRHSPALRHADRGAAGLFHTAVLFDSPAALATAVLSVAQRYPRSFTGSSDHLVSTAFYFDDPEGNGVELYWDRPRSAWAWDGDRVRMATLPLDPNAFLQEHLRGGGAAPGLASIGHVHLQVGDVASAREFYVDRLGFETTARLGDSALFVSAGGYHHHMAMNTWNSRGAGPRTRALGLGRVDIAVPTADDLGALGERMRHYGVAVRDDGRSLDLDDPWANLIRVTAAA